jgi:hypothetical protein
MTARPPHPRYAKTCETCPQLGVHDIGDGA